MSAPRTFLRFAICGLFINALVLACTVKEEGGDDDASCNPGDQRTCTCDDGDDGLRKCNSDGDGYGKCVCDSTTGGTNAGGDGSGATAGTGGSSAGYTNGGGGTGGYAAGGYSGGGSTTGGTDGGSAGDGGSGGSEPVSPEECSEDPEDDCANCYQQACCDEWSACLDDEGNGGDDCSTQFFNIMACAQIDRDTKDTTPDDLKACGEEEISGGSVWSDGLRPQVKPLIDCLAGGTGWGSNATFSSDACKVSCFDQL